jgi:hypothetical protein
MQKAKRMSPVSFRRILYASQAPWINVSWIFQAPLLHSPYLLLTLKLRNSRRGQAVVVGLGVRKTTTSLGPDLRNLLGELGDRVIGWGAVDLGSSGR